MLTSVVHDDRTRRDFFAVLQKRARLEGDVRRQNLLHQQGDRNGLEHVVNGIRHVCVISFRLCNQIRELRVLLAFAVSRRSTDDLNNFGQ